MNLQALSSLLQLVMKLFTVSDETYIGTDRTVPVSFVTDCKSYTTDCKSVVNFIVGDHCQNHNPVYREKGTLLKKGGGFEF